MEFRITPTSRRRRSAFTLLELLIASGVSLMALTSVLSLSLYTSRSIASMTDSVDLNARSRYAVDRMSKKLRQASAVRSFSPTAVSVTFNGSPLTYTYQPSTKTLVENENGRQHTLLRNCESLAFDYFKRNPISNSFNQFPAQTATNEVKLIRVQWQCRTTRVGKAGGAAEMTSAKIVMRAN